MATLTLTPVQPTSTITPTPTPENLADTKDLQIWVEQYVHAYGGKVTVGGIEMNASQLIDTIRKNAEMFTQVKKINGVTDSFLVVNNVPLAIRENQGMWQEAMPGIIGPLFHKADIGISHGNTDDVSIEKRFNLVFEEYDMKWPFQEPIRGKVVYENPSKYAHADKEINDLYARGKTIMAGHLVMAGEIPAWFIEGLRNGSIDGKETEAIIKSRVTETMNHFKEKVSIWTVVNEYHPKGIFDWANRDPLYDAIGENYVFTAYTTARETDPKATLLLNEAGNYWSGLALYEYTYQMANKLKNKNLIDGVGLQFHVMLNDNHFPTEKELLKTFLRYKDMGIPVYITELDINLQNVQGTNTELISLGIDPTSLDKSDIQKRRMVIQGEILRNIVRAAIKSQDVKVISFFGGDDKTDSWLVSNYGFDKANGTLFENGMPKLMYFVLLQELYTDN